jgi:hypothetical protein
MNRWIFRTPAERTRFLNDYESKLRDELEKARHQVASWHEPELRF